MFFGFFFAKHLQMPVRIEHSNHIGCLYHIALLTHFMHTHLHSMVVANTCIFTLEYFCYTNIVLLLVKREKVCAVVKYETGGCWNGYATGLVQISCLPYACYTLLLVFLTCTCISSKFSFCTFTFICSGSSL